MPLLLIRRSKSPNWWIRGSVRGLHIFESTRTADQDAAETIRIIRERQLLDESIFGRKINITFNEAADAYLRSGGSQRFLRALRAEMGTLPLRTIRQADLDATAHRLHPRASPQTKNRQCYTPFIAVWNHAVKNDWADLKMWQRPRRPKGTTRRAIISRSGAHPVDYDRAALFVAHMPPAPAMVLTALFYTGLRPIELFTLEKTDIFVENRWLVVNSSKTGEPRGVPIHEFLVPLFRSLMGRRDRLPQVFRSVRGKPYTIAENHGGQLSNTVVATRKRLLEKGEVITDVSPYTARHSVSTQLVINGVHPHIKDQILGHAVDSMSRRYTRVPQAPLIEAINTLPVPSMWKDIPWWDDPLRFSRTQVRWGKR
jgi:integrase